MMQSAIDKIRELRSLHEDGLLTRDEFDQRKHALLDALFASGGAAQRARATEIGLMAGQEVGPPQRRYRLAQLLAQGRASQVWRAADLASETMLGTPHAVALKIVPPTQDGAPHLGRMLVQEAVRMRALAHPHIVRVFDWLHDPATGSCFMVMEHLDGETLERMLERAGPMDPDAACAMLASLGAALDHAFAAARLVHRDLKPANVFVTAAGRPKLLDFGIAAGDGGPEAPPDSGTPGYRAPEAPVTPADRRQDVYAAARMFCRMLGEAGIPAGCGQRAAQVLRSAMSADPGERPGTVSALAGLLARALALPLPQQPQPPTPARGEVDAALLARHERARRAARQRARQEAEAERLARKEILRQQLMARRALELEKARLAPAGPTTLAPPSAVRGADPQPRTPAPAAARLRDRFLAGDGEGPELVLLPVGRFLMGSGDEERAQALRAGARPAWLAREAPAHPVVISDVLAMARHPVSVGQWRAFARDTNWKPGGTVNWVAPGFGQDDTHPVVGVSWHDAQLYVRWLSVRTGKAYRLPTEAEWEYACRAGSGTAFSFGDAIAPGLANYDCRFAWNGPVGAEPRRGTSPAGSYPPNAWGLCDMHGNVWEWVQDTLHDNYEGAPADGRAWEEGGDPNRRVLRGGSWLYHPRYLRSAVRNGFNASLSNDKVGFRVVRAAG